MNNEGHITRQYIYLADMPMAVIDTPEGASLEEPRSGVAETLHELAQVMAAWFSSEGDITYLHTNHLGAVEAATNIQGQVIWQVAYEPFGAASVQSRGASKAFALHLRLPGQYEDVETGLYYNDHRYYDPQRGEYISPDPLGNPNGPNPYAYVANNPLNAIDPLGLILFAFDGTDNSDQPLPGSTVSNVVRFRNAYDVTANGNRRYVTGVGTDHTNRDTYGDIIAADYQRGLIPDKGGNYSGPDRVARMRLYLSDEADGLPDQEVMQIDIIGFSRGAAQARHLANLIANSTRNGVYWYQNHDPLTGQLAFDTNGKAVIACQRVNFRFMGLWDTVLSTNRSDTTYNLAIPASFKYVAQAVALNEYRGAPNGENATLGAAGNFRVWDDTRIHLDENEHYGGFPLESIGASSNATGRVRVERGFIGAHADIGGGYGDNNGLSTVALSWMVGQAQVAGVKMNTTGIRIDMANPAIHDQSNVIRFGDPTTAPRTFEIEGLVLGTNTRALEDRRVNGGLGGGTQRTQTFGAAEAGGNRSMTNADPHEFIAYTQRRPVGIRNDTRPTNDIPGLQGVTGNPNPSNITGQVNMLEYLGWLRDHGYAFAGEGQW